jgi:hypothetical protein
MQTIHWLYLVTVAMFVASIGLFVSGASSSARVAADVRDVASVRQIMDGIVMPAAAVVFGSVATIVTAEKTDEHRPRTEDEWALVGANAAAIIESGNLLLMGKRVADEGDWVTMTRAMMDAAAVTLKATEARDVDGLFASGEALNESCDACHTKYQQQ